MAPGQSVTKRSSRTQAISSDQHKAVTCKKTKQAGTVPPEYT